MNKRILITALLLAAPELLWAQKPADSVQGQFYVFTAPLVSNTQYYFNSAYSGVVFTQGQPLPNYNLTAVGGNNTGFGGEILPRNWAGIGVGVELGYAGPDWSFDGNGAIGTGSVNGTYDFLAKRGRKRLDPFATGGYSLYFGQRTTFTSGYNFGGGLNFWAFRHVALRSEVRCQAGINRFAGFSQFTHYAAFRFGVTFR